MISSANGAKRSGTRAAKLIEASHLRFVEAFIREPFKVGALWPSSDELSRAVVDGCDFKRDDLVVELGPGTGSFTKLLLKRPGRRGRPLPMEIRHTNTPEWRRRFPHCDVIPDSAEHLPLHLGDAKANCVVSGLAWGNMLPALQ